MPDPTRKVTLKDIARQAGVSITAVSHVMNNRLGHVRVSPAKRQAIRNIARQMGYVPNRIARSMVGQRSHTLGVIGALNRHASTPDRRSTYFLDVLVGVEDVTTCAGYNCLFITSDMSDPARFTPPQAMRDGSVDGVVLVGHTRRPILDKIIPLGLPCVQVGSNIEVPDAVHCIYADLDLAFAQAAQRLMALGHRDIGLMLAIGPGPDALARHFQGLAARLPGLNPQVAMMPLDDPSAFEAQPANLVQWILEQPRRPTAMIVHALFAQPILHHLTQAGLRCPQDISLVGYGEGPFRHLYESNSRLGLTTIELPVHLAGVLAALHLLERLGDDQYEAMSKAMTLPSQDQLGAGRDLLLPCAIHWRQTCGLAPRQASAPLSR